MAELLFDHLLHPQYATFDKANYATQEQALEALEKSSTIYVGNLDPQTSEMQIRDFFSVMGPVVNVIKGICLFVHRTIHQHPCLSIYLYFIINSIPFIISLFIFSLFFRMMSFFIYIRVQG